MATKVRLFSPDGETKANGPVLAFHRVYEHLSWASQQDSTSRAGAGGQGDGTWSLGS